MRQKTFYGITDQRIIILSGIRTKQSRFIAIREIDNLQKFEDWDGSGSIILGFEEITSAYQSEMLFPGQRESTPRLKNLPNAGEPFAMIEKLRRGINPAD